MSVSLLTTGKAARLCSVKPDTVLKWIKKGRLPATRTVGGHYRVEERDLFSVLSQEDPSTKRTDERVALCSRPMRCWEYMNNAPGAECEDCVVYKVHATWCFRLVNAVHGAGHAKRFCGSPCQECPYYRRVHGLPTNVLVITQDESLIQGLARRESESVNFRFARRGYDASAIISVWRPAFVVFDQAILETLGVALLDALASDQRTLGARILVAVRKGAIGYRCRSNAVFATVEEPFNADEIVALINRSPVETLPLETAEATSKP
ncbi:MAG: helix-turn-helix domain-containing protein [Bryobacteraceae bacterium]